MNNTVDLNKRVVLYDIVKGIAIYLVVLGHSIQYIDELGWQTDMMERYIYAFHMPLFIFVSGYFFYPSVRKYSFKDYLRKKFLNILLPSISVGICTIIMESSLKIIKSRSIIFWFPENWEYFGLWFLTLLFVILVIGKLIAMTNINMVHAFSVLVIIAYFLPDKVLMANQLRCLLPFFVLGMIMKIMSIRKVPSWLSLLAFVVFVFGGQFYRFEHSMYFFSRDNENYLLVYIYRVVIGLSGIISTFTLCVYLTNFKNVSKFLSLIGQTTLPIYAIHVFFFSVFVHLHIHIDNTILILAFSVLLLIISYFIYVFTNSQKYISLFFYGRSN